jgi:glycosyltransferase involved in cell wall biosynthesis
MDAPTMSQEPDMAAVVIGRNEGGRLEPSLRSVEASGVPLVYVDSGSVDGSPGLARGAGAVVLELDPARSFSAARARNEGVAEALRLWPHLKYVLFLDGDCTLDAKFPAAAAATFETESDCAIVTGHLAERWPDASVYNRLCAIEWRSAPGRIENFAALGGIMAARVSAILEVGGFNETMIAGEDSELGVRLALAGHSIIKIDVPMAVHDAEMLRFGQWWKRAVRGGHALAQRYSLNGGSRLRDCRREFFSTLFWGIALPLVTLCLLWPSRGLSLLLLAGYLLLAWRVYRHYLRKGLPQSDAALAARFTLFSKFANAIGVFRYMMNRVRGRFQIIEYKLAR